MKYLIDIGSNSIKTYLLDDNRVLRQLNKKSYKLSSKYEETSPKDISKEDRLTIINTFLSLVKSYSFSKENTKIFATGHFRYMTNLDVLINEFSIYTDGLFFNVISQELETFYQDVRFLPYSKSCGKTMVVTVGGGSIQVSFYNDGTTAKQPLNLKWGVKHILSQFPDTNTSDTLASIIDYVLSKLPDVCQDEYPIAFLPGGEIEYMKKAKYPITENSLLNDEMHPVQISFDDYQNYNETVFTKMSMDELTALMPEDPGWMLGARAYSAIAQAICKHFGVRTIVPSDCNIMDGIIQQEARTVVLCGSYNKYIDKITALKDKLVSEGIQVLSPPQNTKVIASIDGFVVFEDDELVNHSTLSKELDHIEAMKESDIIIICNYDDYVGESTAVEIGHAIAYRKKIVFLENHKTYWPVEIGLLNN